MVTVEQREVLKDLRIHLYVEYGPTISPAATRVLEWVKILDELIGDA
jgi:hypothetical protein